ncbi:hypothetical protein HDU84_001068 [Entophlyctis sp. JEL0112]|nr:hypothetical protein HDU84_001068 [Entophlyctis sp. JEL0112]
MLTRTPCLTLTPMDAISVLLAAAEAREKEEHNVGDWFKDGSKRPSLLDGRYYDSTSNCNMKSTEYMSSENLPSGQTWATALPSSDTESPQQPDREYQSFTSAPTKTESTRKGEPSREAVDLR